MKKNFLFFIKVVIAGSLAVAIISVISIFYNYTGVHIDNKVGTTDYTWESGQIRTNMTEGFAWIRLDDYGFNNTSENAEKAMSEGVDILLMGSSHMEAMQVSENENLGALLNKKLEDTNTYNIGMSGHDVYRVMANVDTAVTVYQPKEFLIMEIDEIALDMEEMMAVLDGTAKKIPSYDSGIVYQMQKIPAIKWIYKSLDEWMSQSKSTAGNVLKVFAAEEAGLEAKAYRKVLEQFLELCKQACEKTGCTPIIFYHQQGEILANGEVIFPIDEADLQLFADICEEKGIIFVNMIPAFVRLYEETKKLPHGFANTYVGSGHVNAHGHDVFAEELVKVILEQRGEK